MAQWTDWNQKAEMLCSWALVTATAGLIWKLQSRRKPYNTLRSTCQFLLVNLILFSPVGRQNWLWGIQLIVFVPLACLCFNLVVLDSHHRVWTKLLLICLSSTVSTFSYANGMLVWGITAPAYLWHNRPALEKQPFRAIFLLMFMTFNVWLYFHDYVKPPYHPSFSAALFHPLEALQYFFAFTGLLFSAGLKSSAILTGVVIFSLWVMVGVMVAADRRNRSIIKTALPWLAIGILGLSSAVITTLGRVGFGVNQALSSRYAAFGAPVFIGLIYLVPIMLERLHQYSPSTDNRPWLNRILSVMFIMFILVHISSARSFLPGFRQNWQDRLKSKALITFSGVFPNIDAFRYVYPHPINSRAKELDAIGYWHPKMAVSRDITPWAAPGGPYPERGALLVAQPVNARQILCIGWTRLQQGPRAADTVLLTYRLKGMPAEEIVAVVEHADLPPAAILPPMAILPPSFLPVPYTEMRGFRALILPMNGAELRAWAFDAITGKAYLLPNAKEN
ncbi:MAG: hypothetical protein JEZ11_13055 [Desulfobacterales bacterium]|nr:hypothetical protein [Desulfobacterales bacterium]